jgi:hypothetical protein
MKLPDLTTVVLIAGATLVVLAAVTNLLLVVFRALGLTGAAATVARYGAFAYTAVHIVEDLAAHPNADGAKLAIADLDELAEKEPALAVKLTGATSRIKSLMRLLGITVAILVLAGCSGPMADVVHVVQVEGRIVTAAEPCLVSAYKAEQQACIDDHADAPVAASTCVAGVRARWKPVIDALVEEHDARCKLEPAKCPAPK